ncbi:bifunctional indole-3-glycerol-phosphate synthase TrpC/phosphoribosylanthranilate isomerase TrpF [Buchnera aphidicola (Mollitrichosiphum nigrofasciatum)]|uniref:bifunctional indole-3-glycerol-phosphate synthase TrpC/phosphoribosylanthranilate isomerase TrpF n=1 Tax=Buchnera aphidicola TaxID=9 RepID=UPI0031B876AE
MKNNILKKILKKKKEWIHYNKIANPISSFKNNIIKSDRNFYSNLKKEYPAYILECKKYSPSHGLLRNKFDLPKITNIYKKYASAISVVTDEEFFKGSFKNLLLVRNNVHQPVLCKDFIIDKYQIYLARYYKADAILLMLSILNDAQYIYLSNIAKKLNMGILTEIYDINEMHRAQNLKAKVIGINNRNLNDLNINIQNTQKIAPLISKKTIIISESGINSFKQIKKLRKMVHGFLIGSYLMKKKNIDHAIKRLIFGNNKICGLTNTQDAICSEKNGAIYGGLILCKNSPRKININKAKKIISNTNLKHVAVFQNNTARYIINVCKKINLYAIQLHGNETQEYINNIRRNISSKIKIWKSIPIINSFPNLKFIHVKKYIFDNIIGGSGNTFNWSILKNKKINNIFIAGGLNIDNCKIALKFDCFGLDFNSGIESIPGIKSEKKIQKIFKILRTF